MRTLSERIAPCPAFAVAMAVALLWCFPSDAFSSCCPEAFKAGELIVGFEPGITLDRVEEIASQIGALVIRLISDSSTGLVSLMGVPAGEELEFIPLFEALPEVRSASPNFISCIPELPSCDCCPCGLTCPTLSPCTDPCPGAVPDGYRVAGSPLTAELLPGGSITLSWGASCSLTNADYEIYEGVIGNFRSHAPRFCSTDRATTKTFAPATQSTYYLVVPRDAEREGSYGTGTNRVERLQGMSACLFQTTGGCVNSCPHEKCTLGDPLAPACDDCVASICEADPFCCSVEWDADCRAAVRTICNSQICAQAECEQAGGLWTFCGREAPECYCPGVPCIDVCVSECLCGGADGYRCPPGMECNIAWCSADLIGICQ